jgi:TatA/E family protein of Tat protein translocase
MALYSFGAGVHCTFGAKKLPDSARSLAKSLKIFKSELKNNDKKEE